MATKQEYRDALDALELAVIGVGIPDLVEKWGHPRHRPEIGVVLSTNVEAIYRVYDAWIAANRLMNAREQCKGPEQ